MKINYLFNSCFTIETENNLLIFDYFRGAIGNNDILIDKKIFVFSSHSHGDHYNPVIFEWLKIRNDITYILSSDIKAPLKSGNIILMSPYDGYRNNSIKINTFGSTDMGVSFLINADGINIFHAGDLNWWYWWDDAPKEIEDMENRFKEEIEKIKAHKVDIAFFPVDPRLKHNYHLGGEHFIREIKPSYFIPMHFGNKYSTTAIFANQMKSYPTRVLEINCRGQEFIL